MGDLGHVKIFYLNLPATPSGVSIEDGYAVLEVEEPTPYTLTEQHTASLPQSLPKGRLLFTQNSLKTPNDLWLLSGLDTPNEPLKLKQISHFAETHLQGVGLLSAEEFWFDGANGTQVHGFALKPRGWEEGKKKAYPAVLLIHGGPQSAWEDAWSTRWNPNGKRLMSYTAVPFTRAFGSLCSSRLLYHLHQSEWFNYLWTRSEILLRERTKLVTFTSAFTDSITEDWGGRPFIDLKLGWKFALQAYPEVTKIFT